MISNDLIWQFIKVVEAGSSSKAAELLNVNPSSISRALKRLEHEVGLPLFRQSGRTLTLTKEGKDLFVYGIRSLSDYQIFLKELRTKKTDQDILRLATFEMFSTYFTAYFAETTFSGKILALEKTPGAIEESLLKRESDVGITYAPFPNPKLEHLLIGKSELRVYARKGAFKNIAPSEIPFAAPIHPLALNVSGLEALDGWPADVPRNVHYSFSQLQSGLATTERGLNAINIPVYLANLVNERNRPENFLVDITERFKLKKRNFISIHLVKRREDEENLIMKKLAKAIRSITK